MLGPSLGGPLRIDVPLWLEAGVVQVIDKFLGNFGSHANLVVIRSESKANETVFVAKF